jgi:LysM repeat protein
MTRKQMALILAANAVISAVISVIVALLMIRPVQQEAAATPTHPAESTQTIAGATPTVEQIIHVVEAGDTISGLAFRYDVPGEDIIAVNQLQNPNYLQLGMELIIPLGGLPEFVPTITPVPTPTDTPIPFEPPSADMTATAAAEAGATVTPLPTALPSSGEIQIEISEILEVGEIAGERVVISNVGNTLADMQGWTLSDVDGNTYTFPNFRLWAEGNVIIHTRVGEDGNPPSNFFWGKLEAIWSLGEVATLKDADGQPVSTFAVRQ